MAGEEIADARRHSCFLKHVHQQCTGDRGRLGRLHDHGVAGDQRRETIPAEDRHREIPRRNDQRHAARPVMLIAFFAEHVLRQIRPANDPHLLPVEEEEIDRLADVAVGFGPRLADFVNFECGELEPTAIHDRGHAFQELRAMIDAHAGPMFKGIARRLHRRSASGIPASATEPTISVGALGLTDGIHLPVVIFCPLITSGYCCPKRGAHFT